MTNISQWLKRIVRPRDAAPAVPSCELDDAELSAASGGGGSGRGGLGGSGNGGLHPVDWPPPPRYMK